MERENATTVDSGSWIKSFLADEKFSNVNQPQVINQNPKNFTYPAGEAPFELLFRHNPILYTLLPLLSTPSLISVFFVSKSTKGLLADMTPFFRNLAFVPESNSVKWIRNETLGHISHDIPSPLRQAFVDFQEQRERERTSIKEAKEMIDRYISDTLNGTNLSFKQIFTKKYQSVRYHFFRRLRGRHLCQMIETFPVGRRLTTLIIDGAGISTNSLKFALSRMEGTLHGVSAKWCRHIECYMWSEWILEAMYKSTPFALQWLKIYGSGNTPMSTFSWNEHPDQLTPLRQHPNDPDFPEESPTMLSDWKPKPNLLANLIPFEVHYDHTMEMLTPQNLNTFGYGSFLHANRRAIGLQRESFLKSHPRPALWEPPPNSILHDLHPLIALLAIAKFKSIELDISYCMNGRRCYSFLYNRPAFVDPNQTIQGNPNNITVSNTLNGLPHHFIPAAAESGDAIKLHTHCVAEVGKRREDGGGACVNCGLWEDRLAEAQHQGNTAMKNIGGVLTGDSIGIGRISVGNLCLECTTNMTCISCNAFYCNSCLFRSTPPLPRIPTAVELPDPEFLQMICTRSIHGPYCQHCIDKYTDTCVDCDEKVCKECLTPNGLAISTNIFGRVLELDLSYGTVYHAQQEHAGNYGGWDKMLSEEKGPRPHYFETDSDSEIDGDISTWNSLDDFENGDGMESRSDNYQLISDAEYKKKTSTANSASSTSKCFPSSSQESEESYDFIEQDPDSDPLNSSLTSRLHQLIHDPRIILSTRVTEKCDGCNDLLCSFCLNYDVDLGTKIYEATEYQECAGKCGLRICKSCLHGEEFVRVWCYEQCGAWLCPLCTYGKRDVVFVCHPGSRGERWEWGRGEFLPFMWWTCRYLGIRHCNSKNKTKNDNESKTEDMSKVDNRPEGSNMLED